MAIKKYNVQISQNGDVIHTTIVSDFSSALVRQRVKREYPNCQIDMKSIKNEVPVKKKRL